VTASQLPFEGGMTHEAALRASEALTALVEDRLPLQPSVGEPPDVMGLIAPALLARGAGTVQAITALAPLDREADAGVLLRVLLEHMITLAWLSADPESRRFFLWFKDDSKKRLTMHNDAPESLGGILPPSLQAFFNDVVARVEEQLPDLRTRAEQADADWVSRLPGVMHPGNDWGSFLGLYQIVFRYTSAFTHAGLLGLSAVIRRPPAGDVVEMETRQGVRSAVRFAPLAFGPGLYVSSVAQGWPNRAALDAIFAEAVSA
jgi:Family of unknown function (DUF5677)